VLRGACRNVVGMSLSHENRHPVHTFNHVCHCGLSSMRMIREATSGCQAVHIIQIEPKFNLFPTY
jgi:hypothetical protein